MAKKKREQLTGEQINKLISRIRNEYNDYIIRYNKPLDVKEGFETRYLQALRARVDMQAFLASEISVISELKQQEERKKTRSEDIVKKKQEKKKEQSIADKVMEEHREKIKNYPSIEIHDDAPEEMQKLFGALHLFGKHYWKDVQFIIQSSSTPGYGYFFREYVAKSRDLWLDREYELPPLLQRYRSMLDKSQRNWDYIEQEYKRCLLEVSFFLHSLLSELDRIKKNEDSSSDDDRSLEKAKRFINKVIDDFRLHDLKPQNL
jgi:ribosomal protein L9